MINNNFNVQVGRSREEDEKELLFFVSDEYENERDEDNKVVDPCHQNLLRLLDRLLIATAIFITLVLCTSLAVVLCSKNSRLHHPHSLDITLKSNSPNLSHSQSVYTVNKTIYLRDNHRVEIAPRFKCKSLILCNNLERKSVMINSKGGERNDYSSSELRNLLGNFVDVIYRNKSDIVSPLDQINHCDNNNYQPNILTILPNDDILNQFPRDGNYDGLDYDDVEQAIKVLASQYDEEDAIISVGGFPENISPGAVKCNYSRTSSLPSRNYIKRLQRMSPFAGHDAHNSCNTLMISSLPDSSDSINSTGEKHFSKTSYLQRKTDPFNARIILNAETYDDNNVHSVEGKVTSSQVAFNLQIVGDFTDSDTNQSQVLPSINVRPGYRTDVFIDGCIPNVDELSTSEKLKNVSINLLQTVKIAPWIMTTTETMLVFGRVGYRIQNICTDEAKVMRKGILEEKYQNICKEISPILFKESGESNLAEVVFESDGEMVAPGTNAIFAYIRDNIAVLNIHSHGDIKATCKSKT